MHTRRLANWGPTHETPEGRPHLKPQVGEHLEQRLAAPPTGPKPRTPVPRDSVPGWPQPPETLKPRAAGWPAVHVPSTKQLDWLINSLTACQGPHLQRLPNTCAQSPAGPTSSLGQRQNTQQRGAAGLEETAGRTTAKSVAKEGRKVKPILPTTPSRSTDRKTSRTNLTHLKPAEDFFFLSYFLTEFLLRFCPSFFFYSFFLPSFTFFIPSSCLLLFFLF